MSDNNKKEFPDNLIEFIKTPFGIYLILIFLIILFPPTDYHYSHKIDFNGWSFISDLGGNLKINIIYFLCEIGIGTLVYFIYLQSKKK